MADNPSFQDPLGDIDPVMKDAFSGQTPVKAETLDEDALDDYAFDAPVNISAPQAAPAIDEDDDEENEDEETYDFFSDDDDDAIFFDDGADESGHDISTVQFPSLGQAETGTNLDTDVFASIPVVLSVELGRSKISLKEVMELSEGSIIELDRLVGEPLDLVVNGQTVAQGEVVAIDNNYGLRVTRVVSAPRG